MILLLFSVSNLKAQESFDFSSGLAYNNTSFASSFNRTGAHGRTENPYYITDKTMPRTISPLISLGVKSVIHKAISINASISGSTYKEAVIYHSLGPRLLFGQYTRTDLEGKGYINQAFVRLELCPVVKIKNVSLLFGIINYEMLLKVFDANIVGTKSNSLITSSNLFSEANGGFVDSLVSKIEVEKISFNTSVKRNNDYRSVYFPVYFGIEYEFCRQKSSVIIGSKILLSNGNSYNSNSHSSFIFYLGYRLRTKKLKLETQN